MAALTKILNSIFVVLFIEAILFAPVVLIVAVAGKDIVRILMYAGPFLAALMPYIIWKKAKPTVSISRRNNVLMVLGVIVSLCYLLFFTGLMMVSCAGHPPF